jgi:ADP-ribose pyrophosphatase YjhB (NUDIX family)
MDNDKRDYPAWPICGVGAVIRKDGQVLLVQRGKEPRRGEWSIPGGAVEVGEKLTDAVQREVREECGLEIRLGDFLAAGDLIVPDDAGRVRYHYILIDFVADYAGGTLQPSDDVMDARWVDPRELEAFGLHPWTRAVIEKGLERE